MEKDVIISGYLKFKAGLLNKWSTGFCEICKGIFLIYKDDIGDPVHKFTRENSWISAKNGADNSLFAVNVKLPREIHSKTFLIDAGTSDNLKEWIKGFRIGGWTSAVIDKRLHYHQRSIDNEIEDESNSTRILDSSENEANRGRNEVKVPVRHDGKHRGNKAVCRSKSEPRNHTRPNGKELGDGNVGKGQSTAINHASCSEKHSSVDRISVTGTFVSGPEMVQIVDNISNDNNDNSNNVDRKQDFDTHVRGQNNTGHTNNSKSRNGNYELQEERVKTSQPIEIQRNRRYSTDHRFDHSKIFFDPSRTSDGSTASEIKPAKFNVIRAKKTSFGKKPVQTTFYEVAESYATVAAKIPPVDQSRSQSKTRSSSTKISQTASVKSRVESGSSVNESRVEAEQSIVQSRKESEPSLSIVQSRTKSEPNSNVAQNRTETDPCHLTQNASERGTKSFNDESRFEKESRPSIDQSDSSSLIDKIPTVTKSDSMLPDHMTKDIVSPCATEINVDSTAADQVKLEQTSNNTTEVESRETVSDRIKANFKSYSAIPGLSTNNKANVKSYPAKSDFSSNSKADAKSYPTSPDQTSHDPTSQSDNKVTDFPIGSPDIQCNLNRLSTASDSHERERYLDADAPRARKSSSVASEGVADLHVDVDGDSSVFTAVHQSTHAYLESGYCSKESLSTNESLEAPRSPEPMPTELKPEDDAVEDNGKGKESSQRESTAVSGSCPNSVSNGKDLHDSNEDPPIALTGRTNSDSKARPRLARPGLVKTEKRSSMSNLLSQIKGKLPGKKTKTSKKSIRKENINLNSEAILWRSNESWKERWISFHGSCLLLFKDASLKSPDFALDVRGCTLESQTEKIDGYTCLKLIEKSGKSQPFAAATEEGYKCLLNMLKGITGNESVSSLSDALSNDDNDDVDDSEDTAFQDAIVPYAESEQYQEVEERSRRKQISVDSGNDGDVSCFEASDASNIGIACIAAEKKEKAERRRQANAHLRRSAALDTTDGVENELKPNKTQVSTMQSRHKKVTYANSSPPTPTRRRKAIPANNTEETKKSTSTDSDAIDINVENIKKLKPNRYSVPDMRSRTQSSSQMLRHRSSCLEEVIKLKEAHENNRYPDKARKFDRNRSTSWYVPKPKNLVDENDNHQSVESWDRLVTSSPSKSKSPSVEIQKKLSEFSDGGLGSSDVLDEYEEDLKQRTLLMKRRNSLRLRKDVIHKKVKHLREILEKNKHDSEEHLDNEKSLASLEEKLTSINNELDKLNDKIDIPSSDNVKDKDNKKSKQLFSKFKSNHKSSQAKDKNLLTKESMEMLLTSPGVSPRVRKRSFAQNLKVIGNTLKRNSAYSEHSNRESLSSAESSNDLQSDSRDSAGHNAVDAECPEEVKVDVSQDFSLRSSMSDMDEIDGQASSLSSTLSYERGISKDGLLEIEEFEKFAVRLAAKSFTECIDV